MSDNTNNQKQFRVEKICTKTKSIKNRPFLSASDLLANKISDTTETTDNVPVQNIPVQTDPVPVKTVSAPIQTDLVPVKTDPAPIQTDHVPIISTVNLINNDNASIISTVNLTNCIPNPINAPIVL
jgi:hypothetical protein